MDCSRHSADVLFSSCFGFVFVFLIAVFGRNPLEVFPSQKDFQPIQNVAVAVGIVVKGSASLDKEMKGLIQTALSHTVECFGVKGSESSNSAFELSASFT